MQKERFVRSKVSYVKKGSASLKTIVPQGIADTLKLAHGDSLDWSIEAQDSKIKVIVSKIPEDREEEGEK